MDYRLRHHPRARHVRLRVERDGALVVTAPRGVRRREIDRFVRSRSDWVGSVRRRMESERSERDPAIFGNRPTRIELPAIAETWRVSYSEEADGADPVGAIGTIRFAAESSTADVAARLQHWLKQRARRALTPQVSELAERFGMRYGRISFRNQESRWGSCSSSGNLSLNAKLLFCSPDACRYVLIHELVHLEHPNHSPRFWNRVAELCPDYRRQVQQLSSVWHGLPDWVCRRVKARRPD